MINLSLNDLKAIVKSGNIKDYENKSGKDLLKILSEPNPKISISKKKLKEIEKDFRELRHTFSKEEIDKFRKSFYSIKNHRNLYTSEIKEAEKNLSELEESILSIKSFDDDCNDENKNIDDIRRLFNVFKQKKTDDGFDGRRQDYIEYTSEGDDYNNLPPEEYLDIIRPYWKDLINVHNQSGEWKIQLVILNRCLSSKNFEVLYILQVMIYKFLGVRTQIKSLINFLILFYKDFKKQKKHHLKEETNLFLKMLIYCIIIFIE